MLLAAVLLAGTASVLLLRQDVNWDLRNYHFYNAWAFLHSRLGLDLAAAQLGTFHNPLLELPFYWMVAADWPPRLISFVMALPAGVGAFILAKILLLLFRERPDQQRWLYAALAFAIGITASGPVSLLGSTMNDWPGTTLIVFALWVLLRREEHDASWHALALAGLAAGIASGLKLTSATYAVGLCIALLLQMPMLTRGLRDAAVFGAAVIAGLLLSSGAWMSTLYAHFGSPVFPYFNDIFRSPWWPPIRIVDGRFGPHTLLGWLGFPIPLFELSAGYVTEPPFRDWRMPLLYVALIAGLVAWVVRRFRGAPARVAMTSNSRRRWRLVLAFWGASFVVWGALHAIYRYAMPLELLSGALLIHVLELSMPRRWQPMVATIAAALAIFTVRYPAWGRIDYGEHYFSVNVPPIAPHALVLLLGNEPLAFVLPFFPPDGRFVGVGNNFVDAGRQNQLEHEIAGVVRDHDGPLYALALPASAGAAALDARRLRRAPDGCAPVASNVSQPLELCRLERVASR